MKLISVISIVFILILANIATAEVPDRLIYSGNLVDNGQPYEGSVDLVFSIHDAVSGGAMFWSESHEAVVVSSGKFSVELGLADSLIDVFDGGKYYLQVSVGGQVMLPRVPVASVPYAFKATKADDADTVGGLTPEELGGDVAASDVSYVNTQSGLSAADVQAALDEVVGRLDTLQTNYNTLQQSLANISWNDLADIPAGFADGIDNEATAGSVNWTDIMGIPADIADGDDVGMTSVSWSDIGGIPADIADGDNVGITSVTWMDINNRPNGLDDGDDVGMTSVSWDNIQNTANIIYNGTDFIFNGLNVRVQSGGGSTDGAINGLGNLIVGYDEMRNDGTINDKSGSHNLVVGGRNNYSSSGGLVAGTHNTISGWSSSVSGGVANTASGNHSSVSGGDSNVASGYASSISGGGTNTASGQRSSVSAGAHNYAWDGYTSVSGGSGNYAFAGGSVSGGYQNTASGMASSVSGGENNTASGDYSSVSGGQEHTAGGLYNWAAGELFEYQ